MVDLEYIDDLYLVLLESDIRLLDIQVFHMCGHNN